MRKLFILAVAFVACSKAETPPVDSVTAMAPAPAMLTAADVMGNWTGTTMAVGSDSVISRWATESVSDTTGKLTVEGSKTAINFSRTFDADSMIVTSEPYADPANPKAPMVVFRSVGRLTDGKLAGTSATMLASKTDSVVSRSRWEATRTP